MSGNFELQFSGKVNDVIPVYKYRSSQTGLRTVIAQVEGPIVNGYFCLGKQSRCCVGDNIGTLSKVYLLASVST